jgi:glyoxylase-like metal-dependent hydrolase (beta-lactamase superfamily II)
MEVVPRVHAVRLLGSTAFAIVEEEITLIDAGLRGSGRLLRRYLARVGRSTEDLTRIVCTHNHPDHIGGVRELVTSPSVEVLMHPADREPLKVVFSDVFRRPGRLVALLTRGPEDAKPVDDGDVLPALGGLEVIHTPGHTPGSICLYSARHRVLFVGDTLQVIRGRLALPSHFFSEDLALARKSIERLGERDVEMICFAHYPPWRVDARNALRTLAKAS